jgi:phosphoenolpyruvate-protein phosphotransferase (PTS system enzyme I)
MNEVQADLKRRKIPFDKDITVGAMIEVPSAAILAEDIARKVDFLSIGSNDLIQYIMAVDRDNNAVASLYRQFHPAVLRTIKDVIDAGHRAGIWVGMCGEMAGDPLATPLLVGLGIDELSVTPGILPEIKKIIRTIKYEEAREVAAMVMSLHTDVEIRAYLTTVLRTHIPDIPLDT